MPDASARTHQVYAAPPKRTLLRGERSQPIKDISKGVSVVYYVRMDDGTIKIGTSTDIVTRVRHGGMPGWRNRDRIMAVEFGGRDLEQQRHAEFAHLRVGKTERFVEADDLMEHIAGVRSATGITE